MGYRIRFGDGVVELDPHIYRKIEDLTLNELNDKGIISVSPRYLRRLIFRGY